MATRATYAFTDGFGDTYTAYHHHDGYPEGAAELLEGGVFTIEAFIRKNERAEVTRSHEFHGDTAYRYDISTKQIRVRKGYGRKWEAIWLGTPDEFFEKYLPRNPEGLSWSEWVAAAKVAEPSFDEKNWEQLNAARRAWSDGQDPTEGVAA